MKKLILLMVVAGFAFAAVGQSKLDAYTKMYIKKHANNPTELAEKSQMGIFPKTVKVNSKETVQTAVMLNDKDVLPDLQEVEGEIVTQIGRMLIVRVPIDNIEKMSEAPEIKTVQIGRLCKPSNNTSRIATSENTVNETTDQNGNLLTGKDVIVGIVDLGIDYNHINFKDADGNSRVKYAMCGTTSYTTASEIAALTTDYDGDHGTHTSGTAAGSYTENGLQGMAPEADLVLCGLAENLTDAQMAIAAKNIVDYAKSVGKPVVVNFSVGHTGGAHNGTDVFSIGAREILTEGVVFVLSAGNDADIKLYMNKKYTTDSDSISTLISHTSYRGNGYYNYFDAYSFSGKLPSIKFFVADASTNEIVFTSEEYTATADNLEWSLSKTSNYSSFTNYYSEYDSSNPADIKVTASISDAQSYYEAEIIGKSTKTDGYYIGVTMTGEAGMETHTWGMASQTEFVDNGSDKFTAGDTSNSINGAACTDDVISVGAYTAEKSFVSISNGRKYKYNNVTVGDIAYFSSYGVDMNGISRPDVCAPGVAVQSSYNSYSTSTSTRTLYLVDTVASNERVYQWGVMMGTSMSTPAVTGIIATWMQYKPTLTTAEVREILQKTSDKDEYVQAGNSVQWGAGKINAYAGLQSLMTVGVNDVEVLQDNVLVYPNPNGGQFKVFTQGEYNGATLNVYNMAGTLVYSEPIDASQDAVDVDLSGSLGSGIYVVNVTGEKVNYSTRMIIK